MSKQERFLIVGGILFFAVLSFVSWFTGIASLGLFIIVLSVGVFAVYRAIEQPIYILAFIAIGSMLGNLVQFADGGLIPFSIFQVFYLFGIGVFIVRWYIMGFPAIYKSGFELELGLFFGLIFLSLLWTPNAEVGFLNAIRIVVLSGVLFLCVNWIKSTQHLVLVLGGLAIIGLVLGVLSIYYTLSNPESVIQDVLTGGTRTASRVRMGQEDPNVFASLFFLPLAFTVAVLFAKLPLWIRGLSGFASIILLITLMITFSRGAWMSAIIMLIAITVMFKQYRLFVFGITAGLLLVASLPEFRYQFINITNRFLDLFSGQLDTSNQIRLLLADASVSMFFDSWLIGVGWRGFPEVFNHYYTSEVALIVKEPHNALYQVYAELGLIGLLVILFVIYKIYTIAWLNVRNARTQWEVILARTLFGTLLAYAIFYQFIGMPFLDNQLWLTTGFVIALSYVIDHKKTTNPPSEISS
ncbi:MAG: O-antigen ligase family protein [Bacteroidetes bacterium]|nr:O-antigen ligase family protein [Bacteroidota bacterium]MCH8525012.1 O-antigen ligase family protein [Balneolales bacterium]